VSIITAVARRLRAWLRERDRSGDLPATDLEQIAHATAMAISTLEQLRTLCADTEAAADAP
jgi:alkylation response protein AidB-like acyl-CoA dehydrogenase